MHLHLPAIVAAMGLFFPFLGEVEAADHLVPGTDFVLSSHHAILSPLPAFQPWNSAANIVDGSTAKTAGAIVELANHPDGAYWVFDFNTPSQLTGVDLWTAAGDWPGHEMKDFTITLYGGAGTLGSQSFTAASADGWQSFSLASTYAEVTSLRLHIHSSYGDPMIMAVNEIRFTTVPEPATWAFIGIIAATALLRYHSRGSAR